VSQFIKTGLNQIMWKSRLDFATDSDDFLFQNNCEITHF